MRNDGVRLPTEAEWEFAARLVQGKYPWGDAAPSPHLANYAPDLRDSLAPPAGPVAVKSYPATAAGLYDLAGNVWEWCWDWHAPYSDDPTVSVNPLGPSSGTYKVVRGGSWADSAGTLQVSNRGFLSPNVAMSTVGFRVARSYPVATPVVISGIPVEEHNALAK